MKWWLMRESGLLRDEYKLCLWNNKCILELWNDKYELDAMKWWVYGRKLGLWGDEFELGLWNDKVSVMIMEWCVWDNYGVIRVNKGLLMKSVSLCYRTISVN